MTPRPQFVPRPHEIPIDGGAEPPDPHGHLDPDPGFSMQVSGHKQVVEVRIAGELDVYTAFLFTMAIKRQEKLGVPVITVDLTNLKFIDGSGLAALREARQRADQAGTIFIAKRPNLRVRRFLTLAGEGELLELPLPEPSHLDQKGVVQS